MSWTDKIAIEQILKLRDAFNVTTFIETGTFRGVNAELYAHHFGKVLTCESNPEYVAIARERLKRFENVTVYPVESAVFLRSIREYISANEIPILYLDAHFYDPSLPKERKWIVVQELRALRGFHNCIICIHDFACEGLGHLCYDGEHLDWSVVRHAITGVNPEFHYYTNAREWCDIYDEDTICELPITVDEGVIDNLRYANSADEKRYRGILYAVPRKLDLRKCKLKEAVLELES
jgi:hypothetical protein